jgi:hypothetical protein
VNHARPDSVYRKMSTVCAITRCSNDSTSWPSSAQRIAGSHSSAHGRVPKRSYICFIAGMNPGMTANGGS